MKLGYDTHDYRGCDKDNARAGKEALDIETLPDRIPTALGVSVQGKLQTEGSSTGLVTEHHGIPTCVSNQNF